MEQYIIDFCKKNNIEYVKIDNEHSLNIIYDLFKNSIKIIDIDNDIICLYYGVYYEHIEKNYDEMKKYYLMAIEKGHDGVKTNLLKYYKNNMKNVNINDAVKILNKLGEHQLKYTYIDYGIYHNKHIDFHLTGNYICVTTIQFIVLKYINKLCDKKTLYEKYNNILLLLYSIKQNKLNIPKYLKFNIIYYITQ